MKVRMLTFHTAKNYGAVLQAYSLMSYFKKQGQDVKIVDYNTPHLRSIYRVTPRVKNLRSLIKWVLLIPTYSAQKRKYQKFSEFVAERLILTKRYESMEQLENETFSDKVFVTGSDQVFNPNRVADEQKAFYLDFLPDKTYKFSYAASFGVDKLTEASKETVKSRLEKFNRLSIREESGVEIVSKLTGQTSEEVLDPVFLNDVSFWKSAETPYEKKFENYCFYYRLLGSRESDAFAEKFAAQKGLKLVVLTEGLVRLKADAILRDVGPAEFLSLLDGADFVITESFHGVAFSLIYEKQFVFSDQRANTNTRGYNLLKKFGIERQAYSETYSGGDTLDYDMINPKIEEWKQKSMDFLSQTLLEAANVSD